MNFKFKFSTNTAPCRSWWYTLEGKSEGKYYHFGRINKTFSSCSLPVSFPVSSSSSSSSSSVSSSGSFFYTKGYMVSFSIQRGIWFLFLYKGVYGSFFYTKGYMVPFSIQRGIWFLFLYKGVYGSFFYTKGYMVRIILKWQNLLNFFKFQLIHAESPEGLYGKLVYICYTERIYRASHIISDYHQDLKTK